MCIVISKWVIYNKILSKHMAMLSKLKRLHAVMFWLGFHLYRKDQSKETHESVEGKKENTDWENVLVWTHCIKDILGSFVL